MNRVTFKEDVSIYIIQYVSLKKDVLLHYFSQYEDLYAYVPRMEYYRRDIKGIAEKDMFPGYMFIQTQMSQEDWEILLTASEHQIDGIVRDLGYDGVSTLTSQERQLLEQLLDEEGVMRMSYAVMKDTRAHVTEGPLKRYEKNIRKVDKHNQLAYLNLSLINHEITAGLRFI